ncbi:MAG TPA: hypothetical protein VF066_17100 [Thermoleophilaceae bacterium]
MKATKAYIASLGTTGVLLAASILMLAVVSAVVAFDRWPGANVQGPVQTLVLDEKAPAIRVSASSSGQSATTARAGAVARAVARGTAPRRISNGGGVAGERVTSPGASAPVTAVPPVVAPVVPPVQPPQVPSPDTVINSISNPDTTTSQIADGTQAVTDQAGVSVGRVSPDVGNAVTGTGQQVSQAVRDAELPAHVIPGH